MARRRALQRDTSTQTKIGTRRRTPNTTTERNQNAERLRIVFRALIRFHALQDADHNSQDDDLSEGRDREGNVGYAVAG